MTRWLARGVHAALGLVLVPFLLSHLGKEGYGLLGVVGAVVGFSMLTDMGLRSALARHLTEQVAAKNTQRFNQLASTGLLVFMLLGVLLASGCLVFAPLLAKAFKVSSDLQPEAVFLLRWFGAAAVLAAFLKPTFAATLTSNNRFDLLNFNVSGVEIVRAVGILVLLSLTDLGLYGWVLAAVGAEAFAVLLYRRSAYRVWPSLRLRLGQVTWRAWASMASLGGYLFISQLAGSVAIRANPIIITMFFGPAAVALYAPAISLINLAHSLVNALGPQLHPVATGYHVSGRRGQLQALLVRGTSYTCLLGVPACVILGVFAKPIMRVWLGSSLGPEYVIAARVLLVLVIAELFNYAMGSQRAVLLGMNRMRFYSLVQLVGAAFHLIAAITLVGFTALRVLAVVIPRAVESGLRRPIITVHTARACGLSPRRYFLHGYLGPLVVLGWLAALALGLLLWVRPQTLLPLLGCVGLVALAWVPLCWWVGFGQQDRQSFRELYGRAKTRVLFRPRAEAAEPKQAASEVDRLAVDHPDPLDTDQTF